MNCGSTAIESTPIPSPGFDPKLNGTELNVTNHCTKWVVFSYLMLAFRRGLAARTLPPVTIRELRLALQDEWAAMPQQLIDALILSMSRRCETCLAVRGDHIPY
ncbi:hypothetical protein TNCV_9801 [Trichonephila clavipes]|nr:hypothetical protein TNCV_9801 [Trichonephila clavipes]